MANNSIVHPALADATVFPLGLDKTPRLAQGIDTWKNYPKALPKNATGYGVDCGPSGLFVIDVDRNHKAKNGVLIDGVDEWNAILKEHGATQPKTFTVATTSGGFHYYFKAPADVWLKSGAGDLGEAIDTRADGGYVVGPGSVAWPKIPALDEAGEPILDKNGEPKTVPDKSRKLPYTVVDDSPIAEIPEWLVELLRSKGMLESEEDRARKAAEAEAERERRAEERAKRQAERAAHPELFPELKLSEKQRAYVEDHLTEMATLSDGGRHKAIYNISFGIGKVVGPDFEADILPDVIQAAIDSGHKEGCRPNCAERQAEAGFAAGLEHHEIAVSTPVFKLSNTGASKPASSQGAGATEEEPASAEPEWEVPYLTSDSFTDIGMARLFAESAGRRYMAVREWRERVRGAYEENTGRWLKSNPEETTAAVLNWVADVIYPALKEQSENRLEKIAKRIKKELGEGDSLESNAEYKEAKQKEARFVGKIKPYLKQGGAKAVALTFFGANTRSSDIFDADPNVLLTSSGVVDLATKDIRSPRPDDYFLNIGHKSTPVEPDFKSELWDAILGAFLPETRDYVQVLIGSALTGHQPKPAGLFFLQADGDNGKSTFADVILEILGDYADRMDAKILLDSQNSKTFDKIKIKGKRFLLIEELPKKGQLDAQASKEMAGTERMTGAHKGVDEETFKLEATFLINTNYKLRISETDRGTWKRLKIIPMPYTFLPADEYAEVEKAWKEGKGRSPEELMIRPQDARLDNAKHNPEVLKAALAWAMEGARMFYENGLRLLPDTPRMKAAKTELRTSQDRIALWWEESLIKDETHYILASDLYDSYTEHVRANGNHPEALRQFMETLKAHDHFKESGAEHVQRKVAKGTRSALMEENPEQPGEFRAKRLDPVGRAFYVKGIRFKVAEDFEAEAEAAAEEEATQAQTDAESNKLTKSIAEEMEDRSSANEEPPVSSNSAARDYESDGRFGSAADFDADEDEGWHLSDAELEDEDIS